MLDSAVEPAGATKKKKRKKKSKLAEADAALPSKKPASGIPAKPGMGSVSIGSATSESKCVETTLDIKLGEVAVTKADFAAACNVGSEDKCWAAAFSNKPWPIKLELCNHAGEPGHETAESHKHVFSSLQMAKCRTLVRRAGGR